MSNFNIRLLDIRLPVINEEVPNITPTEVTDIWGTKYDVYELYMAEGLLRAPAGIFRLWQAFNHLANTTLLLILTIIGFLVMVGYQVKKFSYKIMLPRFFIHVVLIQFSWFICRLMFDLSAIFTVVVKTVSLTMFKDFTYANLQCMFPTATATSIVKNYGMSPGDSFPITLGDVITGGLEQILNHALDMYNLGFITGALDSIAGFLPPPLNSLPIALTSILGVWKWIGIGGILLLSLTLLLSNVMFLGFVVIRTLVLYILVIISPFAFTLSIFPTMDGFKNTWFKLLLGLLMVHPLAHMLFQLSYTIAISIGDTSCS